MKTVTFTAIMIMTLGLVSCERYVTTVRNETTDDVRWYSAEFCVDYWTACCDADGLNGYYKADVRIYDLNYKILRSGQVSCYMYVNADTQTPLPCVRHYENYRGQMWTRTIDYEYYNGGMTIYVTDSDFAGDVPGPISFRVMMSW